MRKTMRIVSLCLGLSTVFAWGCAQNRAAVNMLQAPEVEAASKYKAVAVAKFGGQNGEAFSHDLEAELTNAKVGEKSVYRSVVRSAGGGSKKGDDSRSLAAAASALKAEAMFTGEITRADVKDHRSSSTHFVCDKTEKGKLIGKCLSGHDETVNCTERTASLQVQVKLIDAQNGDTVYSEVVDKSDVSKACGKESPEDGKTMLSGLQKAVVAHVKKKVIPHEAAVHIALMDPDDGVRTAAARETFDGAVKFAMSGRMDRACEMFKQAYDTEKNSVALNYNLGVCEEAAGAFWRASEYYIIADKLTKEPNKLLNQAMARNEANIK